MELINEREELKLMKLLSNNTRKIITPGCADFWAIDDLGVLSTVLINYFNEKYKSKTI
jgi:hypothetical protein